MSHTLTPKGSRWTGLLLAGALLPLAAPLAADESDELEVTMEVVDSEADLAEGINELPGPAEALASAGDELTEEQLEALLAEQEAEFAGIEDDFEHDDVNADFDDGLQDEGNFEEDEEVDDEPLADDDMDDFGDEGETAELAGDDT